MNLSGLLKRATPVSEPVAYGNWGTVLLRPDLGSQQEFIVGAIAAIRGDTTAYIKWVPSLARLSKLYGEATSALDLSALLEGCEHSISSSFDGNLSGVNCGSPHVRVNVCGYFSADKIDVELTQLLKRHASAIWVEQKHHEDRTDDDWAYSEMMKALDDLRAPKKIIVPGRSLVIGRTELTIAFDNGQSYGTVVSARYSNFSTVERHIFHANLQVTTAHRITKRIQEPAIFVVLPEANNPDDISIREKSGDLLAKLETAGIRSYASDDAHKLAENLGKWAVA